MEIHLILDIRNIRSRVSSCWIMGMERLFLQNTMGDTDSRILRRDRSLHCSDKRNDRWYVLFGIKLKFRIHAGSII